jgi:hypothetical protein
MGDHRRGERWLGREPDAVRNSGLLATLGVLGPGTRQIQGTVDQRVPAPGGVGQIHRDLGVLDSPGGAGVLPLHPDRVLALLQIARLIHHEHRVGLGERVDNVAAQVITHRVGVPARPSKQILQRVRSPVTAMLGDRPAVLALQPAQHPKHQPARVSQRLVAREPRRDPIDHLGVRRPPPVRIYPVWRGHCGDLVVRHKHRMLARWPPSTPQKRPSQYPSASKITIYGCSTSMCLAAPSRHRHMCARCGRCATSVRAPVGSGWIRNRASTRAANHEPGPGPVARIPPGRDRQRLRRP